MTYPHPDIRPPLAVATSDPRVWEILNSLQILYMVNLIEAEDIDPRALTGWLNRQPRNFDPSYYSQRLLLEQGIQLYDISPPDPVPSLDLFRKRHQYPGLIGLERRSATPRDLDLLLRDGWFVIAREYSPTQDISVVFYGRDGYRYLAYHPARGPIEVNPILLHRYDTTSLQAWRPFRLTVL